MQQVKGMEKVMDRMQKARDMKFTHKMATERGIPAQMMAMQGKEEPPMKFGKHTDKFKSGFGNDGSQIVKKSRPPTNNYKLSNKNDFAASQQIDV